MIRGRDQISTCLSTDETVFPYFLKASRGSYDIYLTQKSWFFIRVKDCLVGCTPQLFLSSNSTAYDGRDPSICAYVLSSFSVLCCWCISGLPGVVRALLLWSKGLLPEAWRSYRVPQASENILASEWDAMTIKRYDTKQFNRSTLISRGAIWDANIFRLKVQILHSGRGAKSSLDDLLPNGLNFPQVFSHALSFSGALSRALPTRAALGKYYPSVHRQLHLGQVMGSYTYLTAREGGPIYGIHRPTM